MPMRSSLSLTATAFTLLTLGCGGTGTGTSGAGDGGGGATDSSSSTTGATGSGSTGDGSVYIPDNEACIPTPCSTAEDCCTAKQPIPGSSAPGCPGAYPNNWVCNNSNTCEHGGCSTTADCVTEGFTCQQVAGVGRCVILCQDDPDCVDIGVSPGTRCLGTVDAGGGYYCVEDVDP